MEVAVDRPPWLVRHVCSAPPGVCAFVSSIRVKQSCGRASMWVQRRLCSRPLHPCLPSLQLTRSTLQAAATGCSGELCLAVVAFRGHGNAVAGAQPLDCCVLPCRQDSEGRIFAPHASLCNPPFLQVRLSGSLRPQGRAHGRLAGAGAAAGAKQLRFLLQSVYPVHLAPSRACALCIWHPGNTFALPSCRSSWHADGCV